MTGGEGSEVLGFRELSFIRKSDGFLKGILGFLSGKRYWAFSPVNAIGLFLR